MFNVWFYVFQSSYRERINSCSGVLIIAWSLSWRWMTFWNLLVSGARVFMMLWFLWDRLGFWIKLCMVIFNYFLISSVSDFTTFHPSIGLLNLFATMMTVCFECWFKTAWSLMMGVILHLFAFFSTHLPQPLWGVFRNIEILAEVRKNTCWKSLSLRKRHPVTSISRISCSAGTVCALPRGMEDRQKCIQGEQN